MERAAARRSVRDAAIFAVLLYTGARVQECGRLELADIAITARTGTVPLPAIARTHIAAWLDERGHEPGPLWTGQRGRLTDSGITQVVLAVGEDARITGLRPHWLRRTFATRLRQGGADPTQVQAVLGHACLDTSARYFRAGPAETAAVIEHVFN